MDRRFVAAWLDTPQLHPGQICTGGAGSDALSQKPSLSAHPASQSVTTSVLETATIKLTSVVSDVWGKSGQSMIKAIIQGESDAQTLTELARGTDAGGNCRNCKKLWKGASNPITACCFSRSSPICSSWSPPCPRIAPRLE